jgi:regulator of protease activity HflC (stomatin/prohibitin superfamily)
MSFVVSLVSSLIAVIICLRSGKIPDKRTRFIVQAIALLVAIITASASLFRTLIIIPAGKVGVVELFGKVSQRQLNPGVHLVNPLAEVEMFSTRLRDIKETLGATSQEGLAFNIDVSLQYKLNPQNAAYVYQTIGNQEQEILISRFRSIIREVTASYPAESIYSTKRQEVANRLRERMSEQITPLGFVIEDALLRDIKLPEKLQEAIQEKLAAEQENRKMVFTLEKERQEAERKRIEAKGIADSQKLVSQGLNAQILQLKAIEATEKLAVSDTTKVVIVGSGQGVLPVNIQLDSVLPTRQTPAQGQ